MATISGPGVKYIVGHQVILKAADKLSGPVKNAFKDYTPAKSVFSLTPKAKPTKSIILNETEKNNIILLDENKVAVILVGSVNQINSTFNHYSKNAKSNTNEITELKELASLVMFENYAQRNKIIEEDELIKILNKPKIYSSIFYWSAVKQVEAFKKLGLSGNFVSERQDSNFTKPIYKLARKLSGKPNDNWNPADIWLAKNNFVKDIPKQLRVIENLDELNSWIAINIENKNLIPISLKQVQKGTATLKLIDPQKIIGTKLDLDLGIKKIDFSDSFANFIIQTKSGFAARVGFKSSSTTLGLSIEGRFIGAGYQLGGVDARYFPVWVTKHFNYKVRSGSAAPKELDKALAEIKKIKIFTQKYSNFKALEKYVRSADDFTQRRFSNIVSYLYAYMNFDPEKILKFSYFSSKKITGFASSYYLIS